MSAISQEIDLFSQGIIPLEDEPAGGVMPALMDAYRNQGYEMGYARGTNDAMIAALEAMEPFLRQTAGVSLTSRELLHSFGKYLEEHLNRENVHHFFSGGLGI